MMYGYGLNSSLGFFGGFMMLIFWGLVIWAIIALVRYSTGGGCCSLGHGKGNDQKGDNAMNILKERYAKGEISKEDFERMKNDLQ